jgi:hypothetical protein
MKFSSGIFIVFLWEIFCRFCCFYGEPIEYFMDDLMEMRDDDFVVIFFKCLTPEKGSLFQGFFFKKL